MRPLVLCLDLLYLAVEVVERFALFLEPASLASLPVVVALLDDTAMTLEPFVVWRDLLLLLLLLKPRLHRLVSWAEYIWLLSLPLLAILREVALQCWCFLL
jgi:hypothetical protein